jgi:hypothetical protein
MPKSWCIHDEGLYCKKNLQNTVLFVNVREKRFIKSRLFNAVFLVFRISYAVWLINDMVSKAKEKNMSYNVLYDISCILHRHLQVNTSWQKYSPIIFVMQNKFLL